MGSTAVDPKTTFLAWIRASGGLVHTDIELFAALPNGDRGIVAKNPIQEGQQLLRIPQELCPHVPLPGEAAAAANSSSPAIAALAALPAPGPSSFMRAVLLLMAEKAAGDASRYAAYIATLPPTHDSLVSWTDAELEALKGTALGDLGGPRCPEVYAKEIAPIVAANPAVWPKEQCGLQAFEWALGMVQSRAFHLNVDNWLTGARSEGSQLFMLPAIDQANHASHPHRRSTELKLVSTPLTVTVQPANGGGAKEVTMAAHFSMKAERDIASGEEILHTYGELSDAQLLQTFGFVEDEASHGENPSNTVHLPVELVIDGAKAMSQLDPVSFQQRLDLLQAQGLLGDGFEIKIAGTTIPDELLHVAQLLLMPAEGWKVYKEEFFFCSSGGAPGGIPAGGLLGKSIMEEDKELSAAACMALLRAVQAALRGLPPGVEQGGQALGAVQDSSTWRTACARQVARVQGRGLGRLKGKLAELMYSFDDGEGEEESEEEESDEEGVDDVKDSDFEDSDLESEDEESDDSELAGKQGRAPKRQKR